MAVSIMMVLLMITILTTLALAVEAEKVQRPDEKVQRPDGNVQRPNTFWPQLTLYLSLLWESFSSFISVSGTMVAAIVWANFIDRWLRRRHLHPGERGRKRNAIRSFFGIKVKTYDQWAAFDPAMPTCNIPHCPCRGQWLMKAKEDGEGDTKGGDSGMMPAHVDGGAHADGGAHGGGGAHGAV